MDGDQQDTRSLARLANGNVGRMRSTVLQVTNLGVSVKDSPQATLVFVTRLDNAAPVEGATVAIVDTRIASAGAGRPIATASRWRRRWRCGTRTTPGSWRTSSPRRRTATSRTSRRMRTRCSAVVVRPRAISSAKPAKCCARRSSRTAACTARRGTAREGDPARGHAVGHADASGRHARCRCSSATAAAAKSIAARFR